MSKRLPKSLVAHVFGEHTAQRFGPYSVPYIEPQRVQDDTHVPVLIAKDANPRMRQRVSFGAPADQLDDHALRAKDPSRHHPLLGGAGGLRRPYPGVN